MKKDRLLARCKTKTKRLIKVMVCEIPDIYRTLVFTFASISLSGKFTTVISVHYRSEKQHLQELCRKKCELTTQ